jgi:hypothetical protein
MYNRLNNETRLTLTRLLYIASAIVTLITAVYVHVTFDDLLSLPIRVMLWVLALAYCGATMDNGLVGLQWRVGLAYFLKIER